MVLAKNRTSGHRMSKTETRYTDFAPRPKSERCEKCKMFREPDRCSLVRGEIAPGGWCKYWEPK